MGTKPQQQLQRTAEAGEHGLFADWQPPWRNAAASGNSRAARAGQDERTPLLEEQLAVLQREHNELRQAIFAAAQAQRRLCAPRQARRGRFEIASEIFPVRHLSGDFNQVLDLGATTGLAEVQHLIEVAGEVAHWEDFAGNLEPPTPRLAWSAEPSLRLRRGEDRLAQFVVLALEHGKLFFQ